MKRLKRNKGLQTYSREHALYLKRCRRKSALVWTFRIGLLVLLLGLWELVAATGVVDPFITSSPSRIAKTIASLYRDGSLFYHVGVTLTETIVGFLIAVGLGTGIALALWWSDTLRKILEPYVVVLNALPKIALGPLIIIWCGTGSKAIVFMTVLVGIIVAILHMLSAFIATDRNKILLLQSMGAKKFQILRKLVIPSSLASFVSMLKVNVGMAWIGSIMGEYIVSKAGLGYLIVYGGQVFKLDLVMSATCILCLLAAAMYFLVALLEKILVKTPES
ncbi:MAG: ABC transporter permease [Candidatus Gallimonas sp.]